MMNEESLPGSDDVQNSGPSEQELLAAVMSNSPIMEDAGVPLPTEEPSDVDPVESDYEEEVEDDRESEEVVSEDDEEMVEEVEEEGVSGDDSSTEADVYSLDDLDDFQVEVTVDGEKASVPISELVKGYATDQSLSKKGRELGEARKALDEERNQKLEQVEALANASVTMLAGEEQDHAKAYKDIEDKIDAARKDGDDYEVGKLKDQREVVQKKYWDARKKREGLMQAVEQQKAQREEEEWNQRIQHFHEAIPTLIPDFDEKVANDIREFAISKGLSQEFLDTITDPAAVKMVDDFRRMEAGVSKGAAKRKTVPSKRVPTKKATPAKKKEQDKAKMVKARAFREDASNEDQMAFLRQRASQTLNNL